MDWREDRGKRNEREEEGELLLTPERERERCEECGANEKTERCWNATQSRQEKRRKGIV